MKVIIGGNIQCQTKGIPAVYTEDIKDKSLQVYQSEINKRVDALPTTEDSASNVANLVKNASGYGVKFSDNFTVSEDGTVSVDASNFTVDLGDYAKTSEVTTALESYATVASLADYAKTADVNTKVSTAIKNYNDTTVVTLSNKVGVIEQNYVKSETLLDNGVIKTSLLPSYVDDVIDGTYVSTIVFNDADGNAITPESGKIYVDTTTNQTYRWSGSQYVVIGTSLALGETSSTAFAGDRGKALEEWAAHGITESSTNTDSTIKKFTCYDGIITSTKSASIKDIAALRGDVTAKASMPLIYTGVSCIASHKYENAGTATSFNAGNYYINTSSYPTLCYNSNGLGGITDSSSCYTDNLWLPTLKIGDIVTSTDGNGGTAVWMVTKALNGTNPVQVANISQLRTAATTVALTSEEYDALGDEKDESTIYVVNDATTEESTATE